MRTPLAALAVGLVLAGCGGDADTRPRLVVSAATSLTEGFETYARDYEGADVRLAFGGSDELASQIRQGVRPDVYAAANEALPAALHEDGLVDAPVRFATNRLVIAVAVGRDGIDGLDDLARPGVDLVVGAEDVPVGIYTREVLGRLPEVDARAILGNVRSNEPDVGGVVAKVGQGAADAGFVYATDVAASGGRLEAVEIPTRLRPGVAYAAAVVRDAAHPAEARAFIDGLLGGAGRRALSDAGFGGP